MLYLGKRYPGSLTASEPGDTLILPFSTYQDSGASIGIGGTLAVSDIEVIRDGVAVVRATDSGYSLISDTGQVGDRVGLHRVSIALFNTSDDTGFYQVGSSYQAFIDSITVDSRTVRFWLGAWEIGEPRANIVQIAGDTGAAAHLGQLADEYDTGRLAAEASISLDTGAINQAVWTADGSRTLTANTNLENLAVNVTQVTGDTGAAAHLAQFSDEYDTGRIAAEATATLDTGAINQAVWTADGSRTLTANTNLEGLAVNVTQVNSDTGAAVHLAQFADEYDTGRIAAEASATLDTGAVNQAVWQADGSRTLTDLNDTGIANRFDAVDAAISAIGASSGGALNFANEGDNIDSALKSVSFVGVETSGTNASVNAEDETYHVIDDDTNAIDIVYQFDVGGGRTASNALFKGYVSGSNDTITVQAYNGSGWDTVASIPGQNGSTNITVDIPLLATYTGTGSDLGLVFIRFVCSGQSNPTLNIDQLLVQGVNIGQSAGYSGGFIYFDSAASNTNTEAFVDGTADNPVSSWTAVKSLVTSTGLKKVDVVGSLTLDATAEGIVTVMGHRATLQLGGQNIGDVEFVNFKSVTDSGSTSSARPVFTACNLGDTGVTYLPPTFLRDCEFNGTITAKSAGAWDIDHCSSGVAGSGTPTFSLNSTDNNTVGITDWFRGLTLSGLAASDVITANGVFNTLTLNGADATVNVSGQYGALTNNLTGSPTVTIANAFDVGDIAAILNDTDTGLRAGLSVSISAISDTGLNERLTAIETKTGSLTFTQAGIIDANILYVNSTQITGTGDTGAADTWRPA